MSRGGVEKSTGHTISKVMKYTSDASGFYCYTAVPETKIFFGVLSSISRLIGVNTCVSAMYSQRYRLVLLT
jgi:hypothetical protein